MKQGYEKQESKEEKKKHYYSKEIKRGSFERLVRLPDAVQQDKVVAKYKNGTLVVTMPKVAQESAAKKVKVEVEKSYMRFIDRQSAGEVPAQKLQQYRGSDVVVYALPRGGLPVAIPVAQTLAAPLDLIITRKITHPSSPEYAV